MNFRISTVLCWAVLMGFASAAQSNQRSSKDFNFNNDDADIEGSGYGGEVNHDLESSGSGFGSDDEDDPDIETPRVIYIAPVNSPAPPRKTDPVIEQEPKETNILLSPTVDSGVIMNRKPEDRPTSFFAQPGILAAVIGGAVVGLLCAILVVMFIVYRMRKKDEGSYALGSPSSRPIRIRIVEERTRNSLPENSVLNKGR